VGSDELPKIDIPMPSREGKDLPAMERFDQTPAQQRSVGNEVLEERKNITIIPAARVEKVASGRHTSPTDYVFPPVTLLHEPPPTTNADFSEDYYETAQNLVEKLDEFGVEVKVEAIQSGPVITRYEVTPARGVRVEKIVGLEKNIALGLKALSVRIQAPVPGKGCVGIEIPNRTPIPVCLRDVLESKSWAESSAEIPIVLGKEVTGRPIVADLTKMPHLLIAGSTGSGKTVCINAVIASLLYHAGPKDLRFIMVDPKIVEMKIYNDLPHMLIPVVTDPKRVPAALKWLIGEMERRYRQFAEVGARNISSFNEKCAKEDADTHLRKLPYIACIVDELADLMMVAPADIETCIARLAQLARAAGIHLIIATQRPSVNVITGIIKANLPSRIAFKVASKVDSRTILDCGGADLLIGKGDMLFVPPGASQLIRAQGALVSDDEINTIVAFLKEKNGPPNFAEEIQSMLDKVDDGEDKISDHSDLNDDLIPQALEVLRTSDRISTSLLQRRLKIGYNRAARIMETLEEKNLIPKSTTID
jgi:S-DNA-T family DNA segregation ATPase FtsK/SpoIIIE